MSNTPRIIYVPYQNDYEGGPQWPAFTNREACERHVGQLNEARGWDEYTVEEWPLLDAAPVKVPVYRRAAHVHVDGYVCAEPPHTLEGWSYAEPGGGIKPVSEVSCGAWVLVFAHSEDGAEAAYQTALAQAHVLAVASPQRQVFPCGRDCQHPAVTRV